MTQQSYSSVLLLIPGKDETDKSTSPPQPYPLLFCFHKITKQATGRSKSPVELIQELVASQGKLCHIFTLCLVTATTEDSQNISRDFCQDLFHWHISSTFFYYILIQKSFFQEWFLLHSHYFSQH